MSGNGGVSDKGISGKPPSRNTRHSSTLKLGASGGNSFLSHKVSTVTDTSLQMYNSEILDAIFMTKYNVQEIK
jgi:hypothetical protein